MKFLLVLSSLCAGIVLFLACGPDIALDNNYYRFFSPEAGHTSPYRSFFRSVNLLYDREYGQEDRYNNNLNTFDSVNVAEWVSYFQNKVEKYAIDRMLYVARPGEIDSAAKFLENPKFPVSERLVGSSVLVNADKNLARAFLAYLGFAKKCEPYACSQLDWSYEDSSAKPRIDSSATKSLLTSGEKLLNKTKNSFIRERYIFQLVRLRFFDKGFEDCYEYYKSHSEKFKISSSIKYRTIGYAAGALKKLKRTAEANYLYSLVYDNCPQLKSSSYLCFSPKEETDWKESLALAKSPREKAVLWQLVGIYHDPLRAMEEIYRIDAKSDLLDLLLVRTIAIIEEKVMPVRNSWEDTSNSFKLKWINQPDETVRFIKYIADDQKTAKPWLWDMCSGYLEFLQAHYDAAKTYLSKAKAESGGDTLVADQVRLIKIGIMIEEAQWPTAEFENAIAPELEWLKVHKPVNDDALEDMPYGGVLQWALGRLSEMFHTTYIDLVKAECLRYDYTDTLFYENNAKLEELLKVMQAKEKTPFEKFMLSVYPYSYKNICDYQAVMLFYQGKSDLSLAKFRQGTNNPAPAEGAKRTNDWETWNYRVPTGGVNEFPADPFLIHMKDCHDCDAELPQNVKYTRFSFVTKMAELEQKLKSNPANAAELCFELANGYYNVSHFGNSRAFYLTGIQYYGPEIGVFRPNAPVYDCTRALEYYKKAMELSSDPEFKTKCCFMAAKCEQNIFFRQMWMRPESDNYDLSFKGGQYFKQLKDSFSQTKYYQEVIKECGYFRKYLGR